MKGVELCDSLPECLKTYEKTKSETPIAPQKSGKLRKSYFLSFPGVLSLHSTSCNILILFSLLIKCIYSAQITSAAPKEQHNKLLLHLSYTICIHINMPNKGVCIHIQVSPLLLQKVSCMFVVPPPCPSSDST